MLNGEALEKRKAGLGKSRRSEEEKGWISLDQAEKRLASDLFYSQSNVHALQESEAEFRQGRVIIKSLEELDALAET